MAKFRLGTAFAQGSGKLGNIVINKGRGGVVTARERVIPANPRTSAQLAVRSYQSRTSQLYKNMTTAQVLAWTNYAATLPQVSKKSGRKIKVSAINVFCGLADKFLQVTPAGTVPMVPPTAGFSGDSLSLTAMTSTGSILFTASAANSANTKTEILLQPLKGKNRVPQAKQYRSKVFVAFATGALTANVTVPTGYYAAAYRFVNTLTGQETNLVPIAVLTVAMSVEEPGTKSAKKAA